MADDALVLTGPTASGKSALAIEVAIRIDAEIISADSRQVYRGMDIGTAKATRSDTTRVPHHGLDVVGPEERYSAGRFARDARRWIRAIRSRGRVPLLAGGTGFFIRALSHPLFEEPSLDSERRAALQHRLAALSDAELERWLAAIDPHAAGAAGDVGDRQRSMRALEVALLTGRPLTWWHEHAPPRERPLDARIFVLDLPRPALYQRIDDRVDRMMDSGLVDEVRRLLEQGHEPGEPGMSATGYREVAALLRDDMDLEEAKDRIRRATRRYARRQLTWFRHQLPPNTVWLDGGRPLDALTNEVVRQWQSAR